MSRDSDLDLQSWGWTDLSSYSSAGSDSEKEQLLAGAMSRRSLRLDEGLLDRSLPHSSASFSVGGASWRSTRSLKSRCSRQLSLSCSESLLLNSPRKLSAQLSGSLHSDASLLSSLLDDSSARENTLVDSIWGLDHDADPKESTIIAEQSTVLADQTLTGPEDPAQTLSRVCGKDREESTYCPSSCATAPGPSEHGDPETPTIYCRERSRRTRPGVAALVWSRSAACALSLLALLYRQLMLQKRHDVTDVLQLWLDRGLLWVRRAAACCVSVLSHTWQVCRGRVHMRAGGGGQSRHCGVKNQKEVHPNGALCRTTGDRWLDGRWRHMTSSALLTRFPLTLLLVLLPLLLLLFGLCHFGPAVGLIEWRTAVPDVPSLSSVYGFLSPKPAGGAVEERREEETESVRLVGLERRVMALWERVEAGGERAEQRHEEALRRYSDLLQQQQQLLSARRDESWLERLRVRLDQEGRQRQQARRRQQTQASRVDRLDLQVQTLAAQTEELQRRQEAAPDLPAAVSVGVERRSHDTLLAEVARLEAALEELRREVEGLSVCGCRRLDGIQQTISEQVASQVRDEVRARLYGGGGASEDSTLLSRRYVSGADLQAALASLEHSILRNISLQLERPPSEDAVREAVLHAAGAAVTQEDVHVIVENALRLFSQDRTGQADYALESGGGSILSTRCSETYETKAALLSLFGVPLWYFSQSPRAVIQPDVHPGNCWAFRGSRGFLVLRLSMRILPTAFTLEHIPRALAPSGTLRSAPRDFSVYGLDDEGQERGHLLGVYTYDEDGAPLQTFIVTEDCDRDFQIIEVQVTSNWGHPDYTCMYRFRVHGTPAAAA